MQDDVIGDVEHQGAIRYDRFVLCYQTNAGMAQELAKEMAQDGGARRATGAPQVPHVPRPRAAGGPDMGPNIGPNMRLHATMNAEPRKSLNDLLAVMAALRTPGTGCPWDLAQTFATIAPYTIEEAYEVAHAIAINDMAGLQEELGDLLLQVVYHARMAEEQHAFDFADVVDGITNKMIHRHPHVFGTAQERAAGAAPGFWERLKAAEKSRRQQVSAPAASVLADVPIALPALTRAVKLQNKAAQVGFDWPSLLPVLAKLKEELGELEDAIAEHSSEPTKQIAVQAILGQTSVDQATSDKVAEEFGDLLFVIANVARHLQLDPEAALRGANEKFTRRFMRIEQLLAARGHTPQQSTLQEMDRLWEQAKAEERAPVTSWDRG
jgi:nucleoside triphosphate diphosphatase